MSFIVFMCNCAKYAEISLCRHNRRELKGGFEIGVGKPWAHHFCQLRAIVAGFFANIAERSFVFKSASMAFSLSPFGRLPRKAQGNLIGFLW